MQPCEPHFIPRPPAFRNSYHSGFSSSHFETERVVEGVDRGMLLKLEARRLLRLPARRRMSVNSRRNL